MICDVCSVPVVSGDGLRLPPEAFRQLLDAGFALGGENLQTLIAGGIQREVAVAALRQQFASSNSDWLLCPKCAQAARSALRHNTKYKLDPGHFGVRNFPRELDDCTGLVPIPAIIDLVAGEEVGLYWLDRTPFIRQFAAVKPFRLMLKTGLFQSVHGPLIWLLFYVPNSNRTPQPLASVECHINPSNDD
jgi:hypothetical protein